MSYDTDYAEGFSPCKIRELLALEAHVFALQDDVFYAIHTLGRGVVIFKSSGVKSCAWILEVRESYSE